MGERWDILQKQAFYQSHIAAFAQEPLNKKLLYNFMF